MPQELRVFRQNPVLEIAAARADIIQRDLSIEELAYDVRLAGDQNKNATSRSR